MAHVANASEPVTTGREKKLQHRRRAFSLLRNGAARRIVVLPADAYADDAPDPLNYDPVCDQVRPDPRRFP